VLVEVLVNLGSLEYGNCAVEAGVHDLPDDLANQVISRGRGVAVQSHTVQMVEPQAEIIASPEPVEVTEPEVKSPSAKQSKHKHQSKGI